MSNLSKAFKQNKALIAFIMAGDPSLSATEKLVLELEKSGADIIEIGIPFSDSIADGPVIVEAAGRAIKKGVSAADVLRLVKKIRKSSNIPIVLMTSYNIVFSYGTGKFMADCSRAGVDGLILPDLPIEKEMDLKGKGVDHIFLVAPNTSNDRIKKISKLSKGFIYLVSLTGTTGIRKELSSSVKENVKKIRKYSKTPIAVGFGISNPEQAREASKYADGVIVGSAIVKMVHEKISKVPMFVKGLKRAIS